MIYVFECEACEKQFEKNLPMADCQKPLKEPCPLCGVKGEVFRVFQSTNFQHEMINTHQKKAGKGWADTMSAIKKASGRGHTMQDW
jgi:putative FmdB family regulatory protein|tara:strand:- start:85 stop:342 length:258 start_codon:yes stop_codon:yes gene_type:complete